jgi:hypothetical protein
MHAQLNIAYPSSGSKGSPWPPYGRREKSETQLWQNLGCDSKLLSTRNILPGYQTKYKDEGYEHEKGLRFTGPPEGFCGGYRQCPQARKPSRGTVT